MDRGGTREVRPRHHGHGREEGDAQAAIRGAEHRSNEGVHREPPAEIQDEAHKAAGAHEQLAPHEQELPAGQRLAQDAAAQKALGKLEVFRHAGSRGSCIHQVRLRRPTMFYIIKIIY